MINKIQKNFILSNSLLIIVAILMLIFSTWIKALVLGIFKLIFDVAIIFILEKEVEEAIFGVSIKEKCNIGLTLKRKK